MKPDRRLPPKDGSSIQEWFDGSLESLGASLRSLEKAGWEEAARAALREEIGVLAARAKPAGRGDMVGTLRALSSILALPPGEFVPGRADVPDKVFELLGYLEESL